MTGPSASPLLRTRVCDLLGIIHPVVLAGMGHSLGTRNTSAGLVAAVSSAGGLGILGASGLTPDEVPVETAAIRDLTPAPFGLNLLLWSSEDLLDSVIAARPPVVSFAWAAPGQSLDVMFARAHAAGCKVIYQAPSVPEAVRAARAGADVIVAQGTEGGGHVGVMGTMPLVPMVVDAVRPTPVLAAGGIADGRGLAAALALGADGVLMGTRFLATVESPLHPNFKQAILESDGHDTELTSLTDVMRGAIWPGALARIKRNRLLEQWAGREWDLRLHRQQVRAEATAARQAGDPEEALLYYGQDAGLITTVEPAGAVVARIVREAHEILTQLTADLH